MVRILVGVSLVVCLAGGDWRGPVQQPPVFRGASDAVHAFVTVTDKDGRLVTTLSKDDFELRDEGKPQPITLFDNTPQPIRLIVMLDVSGSMEGNLPLLRAGTQQLFARLRPDDVARVGHLRTRRRHQPVVHARSGASLRRALPETIAPDAPTPLWRAIDEALTAFGSEGGARPVILVLERRQRQPAVLAEAAHGEPGGSHRAREARGRDGHAIGMRSRSRQPMQPGIGRGGLQAMMTAELPDPGLAIVAEHTRRRLRGDQIRRGSGRRVRQGGRRAAQSVSARVRAAEAGWQGPRDRRARGATRHEGARAKSYVAPKDQK